MKVRRTSALALAWRGVSRCDAALERTDVLDVVLRNKPTAVLLAGWVPMLAGVAQTLLTQGRLLALPAVQTGMRQLQGLLSDVHLVRLARWSSARCCTHIPLMCTARSRSSAFAHHRRWCCGSRTCWTLGSVRRPPAGTRARSRCCPAVGADATAALPVLGDAAAADAGLDLARRVPLFTPRSVLGVPLPARAVVHWTSAVPQLAAHLSSSSHASIGRAEGASGDGAAAGVGVHPMWRRALQRWRAQLPAASSEDVFFNMAQQIGTPFVPLLVHTLGYARERACVRDAACVWGDVMCVM